MGAQPEVMWMPGGVRTEIHLTTDETGAHSATRHGWEFITRHRP